MKFFKILLFLAGVLFSTLVSSQTLTYKFANPRIIRISGSDYFQFDVQVKCDVGTTYLWGLQINLSFDNTTFPTSMSSSNWKFYNGPLDTGTNTYPHPKYTVGATITGTSPNKVLNIAIAGDNYVLTNGPNPDDFNLVPTSYTTACTVSGKLLSSSGVAGIDFIESSMNGQQFYVISPYPYYANYTNPNIYTSQDFLTTYAGRIYSGFWGWSQVGNTINAQWVNWANAVNTSVWDTSTSAATITGTGSLANALRIHLGARLAISAGATLTCSGNTEIDNPTGLWIVSSLSSPTGSFIDNGTITYNTGGTALVERYLDPGKWHGYSIPFSSTSVIPYRGTYMKYWTESNHNFHYIIVPAPADSTLTGAPFRGYMAWSTVSSNITKVYPVGQLNTGSISSIPATRTEATQQDAGNGYNLLGNPYPSALDLSYSGIGWNQLDQKAWVWSPAAGNYLVYVNGGSGNTHSQYIPPEQAFFVHHVETGTGSTTLDLTNSARTHTLVENFLKDSPPDVISLTASSTSNGKMDLSTVYFSSQATLGYDETMDADKITGDNDAPQLYSIITDRNLTINAIPWTGINQVVPLGFSCGLSGNYTITASNLQSFRQGTDILLKDLKLNQTQSLIQDSVYSFSYQTGDNSGRFQLLFSNPYFGVPAQDAGSIRVYAFDEDVYVRFIDQTDIHGTLTIFDQIGRKVFTGKFENKPVNQFHPGLLQGYYVVMVQTDQNLIDRKIYLK